jgi:nitrite reductase/ring-hydroxylating ferredoxin subunit
MSWVKVLDQNALPQNARQVVKVGKRAILLLNHANQIYAVDNTCPHMRLPLQKGDLTSDNAIVCPWHHSAFDLQTGDVKDWSPWPPGVGKILGMVSKQKALAVFPTRVEEGAVWVDLEE